MSPFDRHRSPNVLHLKRVCELNFICQTAGEAVQIKRYLPPQTLFKKASLLLSAA